MGLITNLKILQDNELFRLLARGKYNDFAHDIMMTGHCWIDYLTDLPLKYYTQMNDGRLQTVCGLPIGNLCE